MKNIIKDCERLKECILKNIEVSKKSLDKDKKYNLIIVSELDMNYGDKMYSKVIVKTFAKHLPFVNVEFKRPSEVYRNVNNWKKLYPNSRFGIIFIGNNISQHYFESLNDLDLDNSALNPDVYMPITSEIIYTLTKQSMLKFDRPSNIMFYGVGKHTNKSVYDKLTSEGIPVYVVNSKTDRSSDEYKERLSNADIVVASTGVAEQFDGEYNEESVYISPTIMKGKSDFKFGGIMKPNVTQVTGEFSIGTLTNLMLVYRFLEKVK